MTGDKAGSDEKRIIIDLSCPKDESVNSGIPGDTYMGEEYRIRLPNTLALRARIKKLGRGAYLWSKDAARSYRQLRVDPGDYSLLGIKFLSKLFLDLSIPFGLRTGAKFMQNVSESVTDIDSNDGYFSLT